MKLQACTILFAFGISCTSSAQSWSIDMGAGLAWSKLLPALNSTHHTRQIRYGFFGPSVYLSPQICLHASEHSTFSFGVQLSEHKTGIKFRAGRSSGREIAYESFALANFYVGYYGSRTIANEHARLGWLAKLGIAYGGNDGGGTGEEGTNVVSNTTSMQSRQLTENAMTPDFFMPTTTLGATIGTNAQNPRIADRLTLQLSVTMGWKNIYDNYAKVEYDIRTLQSTNTGVAQYQGMPLIVQTGLSYRLFGFGHSRDY